MRSWNLVSKGRGLRLPVDSWGRSPADPAPLYVGECCYKATIRGGGKGIFCDNFKKLLSVGGDGLVPKRLLEVGGGWATYSQSGGPRGLYSCDFAKVAACEARK